MTVEAEGQSLIHFMTSFIQQDASLDIKRIRALLSGFVFECPLGGDPEDCVCHQIRKLQAKDRFAWVKQLTDEQCMQFFSLHLICLKRKLGISGVAE